MIDLSPLVWYISVGLVTAIGSCILVWLHRTHKKQHSQTDWFWAICWLLIFWVGSAIMWQLLQVTGHMTSGGIMIGGWCTLLALLSIADQQQRRLHYVLALILLIYNGGLAMLVLHQPWWSVVGGMLLGGGWLMIQTLLPHRHFSEIQQRLKFNHMKIGGLVGAMIGFASMCYAIILTTILGMIIALVAIILRRWHGIETIPLVPILSLSTAIMLIWGQTIIWWGGLLSLAYVIAVD